MARYLIDDDITYAIENPVTGEPLKTQDGKVDEWTLKKSLNLVLMSLASKGTLDVLTLVDLKADIAELAPGHPVKLTDDHWKAIADEFRKAGQLFGASYVFSAEGIIRAVLQAPEKLPAVFVEKTNGTTEQASGVAQD